jgi:hypothetical protein
MRSIDDESTTVNGVWSSTGSGRPTADTNQRRDEMERCMHKGGTNRSGVEQQADAERSDGCTSRGATSLQASSLTSTKFTKESSTR